MTTADGAEAPAACAWVNGTPAAEVSVYERALHYGDGLFETIACLHGRPRFLERHLERLARGCARLGFAAPEEAALAQEVQRAARGAHAVVKVLISRGIASARGYAPSGCATPTRITLSYPWQPPAGADEQGVRVGISAVRLGENPLLAGLKHCNRLEQVLARRALDPGIMDALMFSSSGALISGTMSNVFLIRAERLLTPRLDRCGVAGVMRAVVLSLAAAAGVASEECTLEARDLKSAQELFLTNALIGIRPVRELAGAAWPPGTLTRQLQAQLAPLLAGTAAVGRV